MEEKDSTKKFDAINIADFKGLKILIADPDEIKSYSHGEIIRRRKNKTNNRFTVGILYHMT